VTIRGIDDDIYAKFAAEAKKRGVPIGELATQVMRDLVEKGATPVYKIEGLENISVSKRDLKSLDGIVRFSNIEVLEFEDDVDWDVFKDKVERIEDVENVVIPRNLSKFQVLTKARNVEHVKGK